MRVILATVGILIAVLAVLGIFMLLGERVHALFASMNSPVPQYDRVRSIAVSTVLGILTISVGTLAAKMLVEAGKAITED